MTFRVGQKVVCIKRGRWRNLERDEVAPSYGDILTIRSINVRSEGVFLLFVEIVNPLKNYIDGLAEAEFLSSRFRPAVEPPTDISELREIVADVFRKARVYA